MTAQRRYSPQFAIALFTVLTATHQTRCPAQSATFRELPTLGGVDCFAQKVSHDGSTIVGGSQLVSGELVATAWFSSGAATDLGSLGGMYSGAEDVSADGNVIVGDSTNSIGLQEAFVWTAESGMVGLGTLGGTLSYVGAVSDNGRVIVGSSRSTPGSTDSEAFVWSADTGMVGLGTLGGNHSVAWGVSNDGSVIVGGSGNSEGFTEAFVWTVETGMFGLSGNYSDALDVSDDGTVVVGRSTNGTGPSLQAFVWTNESGMLPLESLAGSSSSYAWSLTNDGGTAAGTSGGKAAIWDTTTGEVRELQAYLLEDYGIDTTGWDIDYCSISGNGCTLVGGGFNPAGDYSGWVVTITKAPEELLEDLILDVAEINLAQGISNTLDSKLDAAIDAFVAENAEQRNDAAKKMNSFINYVEAQRGKKIPDADADYLIASALDIIEIIE